MTSQLSKITTSLALLAACGTLNSCRLFGGGKYSSQTEIETDVPESLEQGRPSTGPAAGQPGYVTANGVPMGSNLIETTDTIPSGLDSVPLPGSTTTGGAALTSASLDPSRSLIDIPKPDFASVSVHAPRPPANMLTLDSPSAATPRMSLPPGARPYTAMVKETVKPLPAVAPAAVDLPTEAEIAGAPKAAKSTPPEPGVPLLHSGVRLSDFYAALHQPLLEQTVVENNTPAADAANVPVPDDASLPPPPPIGESGFGGAVPQ